MIFTKYITCITYITEDNLHKSYNFLHNLYNLHKSHNLHNLYRKINFLKHIKKTNKIFFLNFFFLCIKTKYDN